MDQSGICYVLIPKIELLQAGQVFQIHKAGAGNMGGTKKKRLKPRELLQVDKTRIAHLGTRQVDDSKLRERLQMCESGIRNSGAWHPDHLELVQAGHFF